MVIVAVLSLMIAATSLCSADQEVDWTKKCNKCKCVWSSGKKVADCTNLNFTSIPSDLSIRIREIDFSHNSIYGLGVTVFASNNMKDVHKLKLQNCNLASIDKTAFGELRLLIDLDLSKNNLKELDKDTFRDNKKLRLLNLSFNKLNSLTSHLFHNLTQLQRIILSNNNISWMGESVFENLPSLQHIDIGNNKLKRIVNDFTKNLIKFNSLNVEGNLWICDCHLEPFRNKTIKENWISTPTNCSEPPRLRGKSWSDPVIFACAPTILDPQPMTSIEVSTTNVTLSCKATGQPSPKIDWVTNGRIISKDGRQHVQKYVLAKSVHGDLAWNNLTIINVSSRDRGEYKCLAKNDGGIDELNVTLIIPSDIFIAGGGSNIMKPIEGLIPVIIGVIVTLIFLIVLIGFLLCWCRKPVPRGGNDRKGGDNESSSEYINLHGQPDMEKALITEVNPVLKPPRFAMPTPMGISSAGTEVSDVKRNLLDNDSVYIGDDESRSSDFDQQSRRTENMLDIRHPYPPDLLPPFSLRTSQVSPAGSSASTVADTSRLPALHGPQSPLHSPYYDHIYRTLPHSRSHSPFIPVAPLIVPRQGYVTIPRRPRQQSWSSEPPEIAQPLYDNLGIRSTATGSSMNSLNKVETPKSNRMLPAIPTNCDPIAEHDPPHAASVTLPRNLNQKLSPSRTNWARANAEAFKSPDRRNSLSVFPATDPKLSKIPPRPPPKPKKKIPTGPLFEDEGEDGTEV